jgi:hypothetical protein
MKPMQVGPIHAPLLDDRKTESVEGGGHPLEVVRSQVALEAGHGAAVATDDGEGQLDAAARRDEPGDRGRYLRIEAQGAAEE